MDKKKLIAVGAAVLFAVLSYFLKEDVAGLVCPPCAKAAVEAPAAE